jgi:hypothetical protein
MNDSVKSILPSFILVGGEGEDFDPFHDFFPDNLKKLPQYWNFGELLKFVFYGLEDRRERTILDNLIEQRNIWNTLTMSNPEIEDFLRYFSLKEPIYSSRYLVGDEGGNATVSTVRMGPLSESERVKLFLDSLDTDGISDFLRLILGRELNTYEDLQVVLALQRMKGMSLVGELLAAISGYKFNAFYRRYPTGRKTRVKRYRYGIPRYEDPILYNGMWVYVYNDYFEEVEVDEYYLGEGWEKYNGYLGRPVRYDGEEQYTGTGDLVYGEIRFIPEPCEVWITTDVSHLEVDSELKVFEEIVSGFRNLTNSCAKIFFFPFVNFEEKDFSLREEVVLEEVSYLVGVLGESGVIVKIPEEVTDQDVIVSPRVQEYQRTVEAYS